MISQLIKKVLKEVTSSKVGTSVGYYVPPFQPGMHEFESNDLKPFVIQTSKYTSPELAHDSYDGKVHTKKSKVSKIESKAKKGAKHVENNYDFITIGESDWVDIDNILNEDLGVWFGTKKKPKGSKQPKGPWVNICRKVDGKHPPCGRPDTDKGGYPKCRAAGVAGKMSDSQKRAACSQKRKAEKKDTQTGKGQKPVMTSYKPKKSKNEGMRQTIKSILQEQVRKSNMLELGTLFESREVKNLKEAKKIAQQHLNENPRYYCVLHRIGLIEGADATNLAKKTCPSV